MTTFLQEKNAKIFCCKFCDFNSSNRYNYNKHLLTAKHKNTTKYVKNAAILQKELQHKTYTCQCGKSYIHRGSLHNHRKKCNLENNKEIKNKINVNNLSNDLSKELILKLVEENTEIKSLLYKQFDTMQNQIHKQHNQINELIPRIGNNIINKQKLNINIFLNEQCKDALTMEQFLNKIQVTVDNLLVTKNKGLSEGVSNIFIENMNKLSLYERPMHCTDVKREIVYIKSDDKQLDGKAKWDKDEENKKLKLALKKITHVQQKNLEKWIAEHPNWENNSDEQEEYMLLVRNCTAEFNDKENKIIKKLCNESHLNIE